ncbi:uncharacterized protein G2W53_024044 [Senna tora]|uniref:Uncharacterized protein n=1 Tax=Senna tora TaxID=362788 RepID=A0A834TBK1_9FABA|nr:uncharacterized protein G2W53_024044 [Senna tora]
MEPSPKRREEAPMTGQIRASFVPKL